MSLLHAAPIPYYGVSTVGTVPEVPTPTAEPPGGAGPSGVSTLH